MGRTAAILLLREAQSHLSSRWFEVLLAVSQDLKSFVCLEIERLIVDVG